LSGFGFLRVYSCRQKMTDSHTLLSQYARTGSESAFRELVGRYIDLVYSTAFRLVDGDVESAQDVAQTVFVALADQARTLPKDVMLGGWLHLRTRFAAGKLMRTERRRQLRERQAAEMNAIQDHSESNLAQVAPMLDEAIGELGPEDRTAILLRFFERNDFRSVGEALGSSEDAARKRVDRALEKLHVLLKHRGATLSAAALGTALAAEAVTAAPAGLATTISSAAILTGTTITSTAAATKAIAMTALQKALITTTLALAVGAGIYETLQASTLRGQVQTLQQQLEPLADQIQELQRERDDATNRLALQAHEVTGMKSSPSMELLKLRGEVTQLKSQRLESPAGSNLRPQAIPAISNEFSIARGKLTELRGSYSDQHPKVKEQIRAIESLERSVATPGETLELAKGRADLARLQVRHGSQHPDVQAQLRAVESLERSAAANEPSELAEAKAQLARLRVDYGDAHPEVQSQLRRVADLETK
jgi:RNA polymerase sigma factor (sigma-70 family)